MQLPKPPSSLPPAAAEYLRALVGELERELDRKPGRQADGVLYLGADQPLAFISPNGTLYRLSVDDGGNLVTEAQ